MAKLSDHHGRPAIPAGWITREEVARIVGIGKQRVLPWEAKGQLPKGKKFGNVKVWRRDVIERFMETLEVEQEDAA